MTRLHNSLFGCSLRGARKQSVEKTPRYSMVIRWSPEDGCYVVTLPEFGDAKTHGSTYEEAAKAGAEVLELLIETCIEDGEPLPEPRLLSIA
jgi:antitoxin HicB